MDDHADRNHEPSPSETGLTARRDVQTTEAIRLAIELANLQCRNCGQRCWKVYHTDGRTRYLRCKGCGHLDKVVIEEAT